MHSIQQHFKHQGGKNNSLQLLFVGHASILIRALLVVDRSILKDK